MQMTSKMNNINKNTPKIILDSDIDVSIRKSEFVTMSDMATAKIMRLILLRIKVYFFSKLSYFFWKFSLSNFKEIRLYMISLELMSSGLITVYMENKDRLTN